MTWTRFLLCFFVVALTAGCGAANKTASSSASATATTTSPGAAAGSGAHVDVKIVDFAFQPAEIQAKVGDTITWTNTGQTQHTATADSGSFDSKPIDPGKSFSFTFTDAGTIRYHCQFHPSQMTGTITVTAAGPSATGATTSPVSTTTSRPPSSY